MGRVHRVSILMGLFGIIVSTALNTAVAEPAACSRLRQQLASSGGGQSGYQVNSRAVQQQAIRIQQARIRAREAGCTGVLFSRGDPAQCAKFDQTIDALTAKMDALKSGTPRSGQSRQSILASLDANGCTQERPKRFLQALFGGGNSEEFAPRTRKPQATREIAPQVEAPKKQQPRRRSSDSPETLVTSYEGSDPKMTFAIKKGYRTLCVRTCDGYYFPISFSAQPRNFTRDQNACSAMCPAGDAKLYYHAVPNEESADMISVVGKVPYSQLPNAFNYRTAGLRAVPGCACHAAPQTDITASVGTPKDPVNEMSTKTISISAPAYGLLKNLQGLNGHENVQAQLPAATASMNAPERPLSSEPDRQNIRIVGPSFFPNRSEAINLKAPPHKVVIPTRYTPETAIATVVTDILSRIE